MKKANTGGSKRVQLPSLTIGLDLGDRSSRYCVLDQAGEIAVEQEVETGAEALRKRFSALEGSRIAPDVPVRLALTRCNDINGTPHL